VAANEPPFITHVNAFAGDDTDPPSVIVSIDYAPHRLTLDQAETLADMLAMIVRNTADG
jgi:hypothetical protein